MPHETARPILVALLLLAACAVQAEPLILEDCRISAGPAYPGIKARCGELQRPLNLDDEKMLVTSSVRRGASAALSRG